MLSIGSTTLQIKRDATDAREKREKKKKTQSQLEIELDIPWLWIGYFIPPTVVALKLNADHQGHIYCVKFLQFPRVFGKMLASLRHHSTSHMLFGFYFIRWMKPFFKTGSKRTRTWRTAMPLAHLSSFYAISLYLTLQKFNKRGFIAGNLASKPRRQFCFALRIFLAIICSRKPNCASNFYREYRWKLYLIILWNIRTWSHDCCAGYRFVEFT